MKDEVPDRLHAPMSRAALAKEADISPATLKSWSERESDPLPTAPGPGGRSLYTWLHLRDFCLGNPNLTATRQVLQRYRELFVDPSDHPNQPVATVGADLPTRSRPTSAGAALNDGATLRSALADLKTQVQENQSLVAAATQLALDADRAQTALLTRVEHLELAVASATES
ncbi:hypothetical protein [Pimelobacter simplex]|uniref:hypothetical protein n=1 Tax=Nocardioides simplex TaxID=2045 RepID=UPI003AADC942